MEQKIISQFEKSTLLAEYKKTKGPEVKIQTEQELEESLLKILQNVGYEYKPDIRNEKDLIRNLRIQLERLNSQRIKDFRFTDGEWEDFLSKYIIGSQNFGIENRAERIHTDKSSIILNRIDGSQEIIRFIDKIHPENNFLQVINQYRDTEASCRYDVTILVNGLPMVQIELKRRGVPLKEAFFRMDRCKRDSFSSSSYRLFEFIQVFVISNGTDTKYYSNTIHKRRGEIDKRNKSFQFTSFWTDSKNHRIDELLDFAVSFLHPRVIKRIITKYCIFDDCKTLKILRPYQIEAIEKIRDKVEISINHKLPQKDSGGFIWHTCGSGKTLTSFKAAQLLMEIPEVEKVMFVVDRKDLDHRTCIEYENYERGSVDWSHNSKILERKLTENTKNKKIIVTTIQMLARLFDEKGNLKNKFFHEKIVIFIDECHRSQTGVMHACITKHFKNANIFGFTGTPIFEYGDKSKNTKTIFGQLLHSYNICDAINDKNVLPFAYEEIKELFPPKKKISRRPRRKKVVKKILEDFDLKTQNGFFNSIFAVDSRRSAMEYHQLFEELQQQREKKLTVEVIYSRKGGKKDKADKYLDLIIQKSNENLNDTEYFLNISKKMMNREINILIVVDMFLKDFCSPILNTLWVDRRLKNHELIEAFSRTNRIFNDAKEYGNIVSFQDLGDCLHDAITKYAKYGNDDSEVSLIAAPCFDEYYVQYRELWKNVLEKEFPLTEENIGIKEEIDEKKFCRVFAKFLRLENILKHHSEFKSCERLSCDDVMNYKSKYLVIKDKISRSRKLKK